MSDFSKEIIEKASREIKERNQKRKEEEISN